MMVLMAEGVRARSLPPRPPPSPHLGHNTMPIGQCDGAVRHAGSGVKKIIISTLHMCLGVIGQPKKPCGEILNT